MFATHFILDVCRGFEYVFNEVPDNFTIQILRKDQTAFRIIIGHYCKIPKK